MLNRVRIQNFRCLNDVDANLRPLTVLVGPNDSGKSAFLAAIQKLIGTDPELAPEDRWRGDTNNQISILGWSSSGRVSISTNGPNERGHQLAPLSLFQLPSAGVMMTCPGTSDDQGPPQLTPDGGNVPALLDYFLRRDRKRLSEVLNVLKKLIPGLEEVEIATPHRDSRRVDLVTDNGYRFPADRASAGVRLLLFFVALAYHPNAPKTILIEEPETGIHPKRLGDVMSLLHEISQGKHGKHASQVILTTHSPFLLDLVSLDKDQVLVFRRNDDGTRSTEPADADRLKLFVQEFMLGEVWYNQGEEGLVARKE